MSSKNGFKILLVLSVLAVCLFSFTSSASANSLTDCVKCHDFAAKPNQDVSKFILPQNNDGSPTGTVANKRGCINCHRTNIGSIHPAQFTTVTIIIDGVVYGGFKSTGSLYASAEEIHPRHKSYRPTNSTCQTCHGTTSCQVCHVPVGHDQHYLPTALNPLTDNPITTPTIYSSDGKSRQYRPTTCAAAECHQTLPSPKVERTDGKDLCFNCHSTGTTGHTNTAANHISGYIPDPTMNCAQCHQADLAAEHAARSNDQGTPYDCYTCHQSSRTDVKAAIASNNRSCNACHTSFDHVTVHEGSIIDNKCGTCHQANLVNEHLANSITQKAALTCDTCHKSTDFDIMSAINIVKTTDCTACHTAAHNFSLVFPVPADIPLYPGLKWSQPQDASIWANEGWLEQLDMQRAKRIFSDRTPDLTVQQVRDFYLSEMAGQGWSFTSEEIINTTTVLKFTSGQRSALIMFYDSETPKGTTVEPGGYRLDVLYK